MGVAWDTKLDDARATVEGAIFVAEQMGNRVALERIERGALGQAEQARDAIRRIDATSKRRTRRNRKR